METSFPQTALGDVARVRSGFAFKSSAWTASGVAVVKIANVKDGELVMDGCSFVDEVAAREAAEWRLRKGDILLAMTGYIGDVARVRDDSPRLLNQRVGRFENLNRDALDDNFLFYVLRSADIKTAIAGLGYGSAQPNVSPKLVHSIQIPMPLIDEQRAIAAVLGSLDDKVEQNRRTGRKLEALARAVFKAWFVDFEPVKAKAAGATAFPGMTADTFTTIPTRFVDSELGPVPEGWHVSRIGDVINVKGGGTPSTKVAEYWDGGTHFWATPKDLSGLQDPVLLATERLITDAGAECISSGVMPKDTVLLSSRAPVGYTALAKVPIAVNQGFIAMTCDGPLPPHYVLHWTRSALDEIKSRASGTTFPEISKSAFRPIRALVPSRVAVQEFERFARSLFDLIEANARQSNGVEELRSYLLPRLLSGSARVRL